ncbi:MULTISPECIES: Rrf2 family transcriptional regulator [Halorubrum]|uniref:TrmB family transcriptional regulator n=1 Tax=Halorubrum persicum TaxID=1383844 RepID=A0A2G1WJ18_9EURY|nr:Rrf2 family transcriptional regulator [Halorubrum persicum]OYR81260.1 TrmB family transcriptional regulator [Halorubrum sp. E3]PHQ38998.1 TrmB family transcriptional regulator [Halorubrum persicum]
MSTIQLTSSQKRVLTALVNLAENADRPVSGARIAESIDRNAGTVRNRMQSLRDVGLVEGVAGPKGGYVPTDAAYETLGVERMDGAATTPVECEGDPVEGVNVEEIDLSSVANPELCRAELVIRGPVGTFDAGDRVTVGPTPGEGLRLSGVVDATHVDGNTLLVRVEGMETGGGEQAA